MLGISGNTNALIYHHFDLVKNILILKEFSHMLPSTSRVLEIGAGIGRLTMFLLYNSFEHIDVVE